MSGSGSRQWPVVSGQWRRHEVSTIRVSGWISESLNLDHGSEKEIITQAIDKAW